MSTGKNMTREQLRELFLDVVKEYDAGKREELDGRIRKLEEVKQTSDGAVDKFLRLQTSDPANDKSLSVYEKEPSLAVAGAIRCIATSKNVMRPPVDIAAKQYGSDHPVTKALAAGDADAGGYLIESATGELIELLRATAVVEKAGPSRVPLNRGSMTMPKHTAGATTAWLGEGSNATHQAETFGEVTLTAKYLAAIVSINNQLLQYASPDVDRLVRDDLVANIATVEDLAFLRGDGTGAAPRGFANTVGINTFAANTTETIATATTELGRAIRELMDDNVNITRGAWFFAPRTWQFLTTARDGNNNLVWAPEMSRGTLVGYPFFVTTQIPINLNFGAADQSEVYFVNMPDIVIGRVSGVEVSASDTAAYHDGSNVQAAFSRNQTVVRAITGVDITARHASSICRITAVEWGK